MNDDEILERLRAAFTLPPLEPPMAGVLALRRVVVASRPKPRVAWRQHRVAAGAAIFGSVLAVSGTAFAASGAPLPRPLRAIAHGVGLPVDSTALADARGAAAKLEDALADHDRSRVDQAATLLRSRLARLDGYDNGHIEPRAERLLREATELGDQGPAERHQTDPDDQAPGGSDAPAGQPTGPAGDQTDLGHSDDGGQVPGEQPPVGDANGDGTSASQGEVGALSSSSPGEVSAESTESTELTDTSG